MTARSNVVKEPFDIAARVVTGGVLDVLGVREGNDRVPVPKAEDIEEPVKTVAVLLELANLDPP